MKKMGGKIISSEVPVIMELALEMFLVELTFRAQTFTKFRGRKTMGVSILLTY